MRLKVRCHCATAPLLASNVRGLFNHNKHLTRKHGMREHPKTTNPQQWNKCSVVSWLCHTTLGTSKRKSWPNPTPTVLGFRAPPHIEAVPKEGKPKVAELECLTELRRGRPILFASCQKGMYMTGPSKFPGTWVITQMG